MPLLNYTTTVDAAKTIGEIHTALVRGGARQIMTSYDPAGKPDGIMFSIDTPDGMRSFVLPSKIDAVHRVLTKDRKVPPRYKSPEQAERVAWRILKDWLEAQLALVSVEMATPEQVFLPYMRVLDGRTMYDAYLDHALDTQLALGSGE